MWVVVMVAWWPCQGSKLRARRALRIEVEGRGLIEGAARAGAAGGDHLGRGGEVGLGLGAEEIAGGNVVGARGLLGDVKGASHTRVFFPGSRISAA
ncbi:uncharacterized protein J3R85_010986 [Psidium guajava]|nr:uncharacterized protein J3R85_010986 [Psidium guajava]